LVATKFKNTYKGFVGYRRALLVREYQIKGGTSHSLCLFCHLNNYYLRVVCCLFIVTCSLCWFWVIVMS